MVKFLKSVYFELVWYVVVYVFYYCVLTAVLYPLGISTAALTALSLLLILNYVRRKDKKRGIGLTEAFGLKAVRLNKKEILLLAVLGIALNLTISGILNILPSGISKSYTESYGVIISGNIYETVIVMAVATPILEEIFFRGIFQRKLGEKLGPGRGLIAAACVFGFMHFNIVWSIYSGIIGFLLGAVYLYYG
ncbi:MAG: CPBP family intramembrane metalloprotease, partial [Clostridiales bacterium]|nr:CPBP family intramembrane metalloprotease [Clostridiales bacterium]